MEPMDIDIGVNIQHDGAAALQDSTNSRSYHDKQWYSI